MTAHPSRPEPRPETRRDCRKTGPRSTVLMTALVATLFMPVATLAVPDAAELERRIAETDWNLKYSSVSKVLDAGTQSRADALLVKARGEIAVGNLRTARDLIEQAGEPLWTMRSEGKAGNHPDQSRQYAELKDVLLSITAGTEKAALADGKKITLQADTQAAVRKAESLQRGGKTEQAIVVLRERYTAVATVAAKLRDGKLLIVKAPEFRDARQWTDGLRRIDERRNLTEYLLVEARAEGLDEGPLIDALAIADRSTETANALAREKRWDQAYASLELAYLQIEDQWRKAGIEW